MALAVCYSHRIEDHLQRHAIYLEQTFYELIFRVYRADRATFPLLAEIASLRYKSPEMIVDPDRVASLHVELDALRLRGHSHYQISALAEVVARAISESCTLTIHGDMYPELPL
jgi:hypothetical protein